ncbi:hypothetical protein GA0070619_2273 [Micromonospora zamorensis]|nr:hypothetical protein GA0070619_2273 [Micromonospora zamorensis]
MKALPPPAVMFARLLYEAGSFAGAREVFQTMITDLVDVQHLTANEVSGPGGYDWGIDTYVGQLDSAIAVWQSKFFLDWSGESQRGQVRQSFNELMKKAASEGFSVDAWTLCTPCILAPEEQQWFDTWAAGKRRNHKLSISLWNGTALRKRLMQPDAAIVRERYFSEQGGLGQAPEHVQFIDDLTLFNDTLFVRQLEAAGEAETDAAKGLFFAAEALARDLAEKGNRDGVAALQELHLEIQHLWEQRFNVGVRQVDHDGRIDSLLEDVMSAAASCPDPDGIRLRPAHRKGIAHRLVEDARAGWVKHWREIATTHDGPRATKPISLRVAEPAELEATS